jgi:hypothetical protein
LGPSGGAVPPFGQDRHLTHDGDDIRRRLVAEVAVKGADVGDQPLGFAPTGVGAEVDVERRLQCGHPSVMAQTRFSRQEFEIALEVLHGGRCRQRPVPRHDHGRVELQHAVASGDPVGHGTRPDDRVPAVKEDVAREDDPVVGEVDHDVACGVRRAHFQQGHRTLGDRHVEPALERLCRQRSLDAVEGERCENAGQELSRGT